MVLVHPQIQHPADFRALPKQGLQTGFQGSGPFFWLFTNMPGCPCETSTKILKQLSPPGGKAQDISSHWANLHEGGPVCVLFSFLPLLRGEHFCGAKTHFHLLHLKKLISRLEYARCSQCIRRCLAWLGNAMTTRDSVNSARFSDSNCTHSAMPQRLNNRVMPMRGARWAKRRAGVTSQHAVLEASV